MVSYSSSVYIYDICYLRNGSVLVMVYYLKVLLVFE
jgi:hypothetical protein